jgi:hypothetical protein
MPEGAALSPREGLKIGLGLTMAGPQRVQPWEGGALRVESRRRESWSLSPGIESQIESSHEECVTGPVAVDPVTKPGPVTHSRSSRWVQSVGPVKGNRSRGAPIAQPLYCSYEDWLLPLCQFRKNFLERASPLANLLGTAEGRVLVCRTC